MLDEIPLGALVTQGATLVTLIWFAIWFLRQLALGFDEDNKKQGLVPGAIVLKLLKSERQRADEAIAAAIKNADERVAAERSAKEEWRATAAKAADVADVQRGIIEDALKANKLIDHFVSTYAPIIGDTTPTGDH